MKDLITILLIIGYFISSMFIGIRQYMDAGELSTAYIATTVLVLIVSIATNLLFNKAIPGSLGEKLSIIGGGIALLIIVQSIIFFIASPLFINFDRLPIWKIIVGCLIVIVVGRMVFKYFTKDAIALNRKDDLEQRPFVLFITNTFNKYSNYEWISSDESDQIANDLFEIMISASPELLDSYTHSRVSGKFIPEQSLRFLIRLMSEYLVEHFPSHISNGKEGVKELLESCISMAYIKLTDKEELKSEMYERINS